jgi:hypothetical protein
VRASTSIIPAGIVADDHGLRSGARFATLSPREQQVINRSPNRAVRFDLGGS